MTESYLQAIVGKTVVGIDVSSDEAMLRFRCDDGDTVVWGTDADCCSTTWWADALGLNQLRGATVKDARALDLPDPYDTRGRSEEDQNYGIALSTDKGLATLVYRNASNGYYGGWAFLTKDYNDAGWREIEGSEWSA